MFYNLTPDQINTIKNNLYPQQISGVSFLKNVIVNDYGSENGDNSIRIIFSFKDGLENDVNGKQIFKIFNNKTAIKYMKLKLFEILNVNMLNEVRETRQVSDLENVIAKYGALSRDITPSLEFAGDKYNPDAHLRLKDFNDSIELSYDTTFLLARPKINYFTLGAIFYLDKKEYVKDQNIEEKYIDDRILLNKILLYPLYSNNEIVQGSPVQDLRLVKAVFKETGYLDNILNNIVSGRGFDSLKTTNIYLDDEKLSLLNQNSYNVVKTVDSAKKTIIKKTKITKKSKKLFSNAYYSRLSNANLGLIFNVDYGELLNQNTTYKSLLERSNLSADIINQCKISQLKVYRRAVKEVRKNVFEPQLHTNTLIASSGETMQDKSVVQVSGSESELSEIALKTDSELKIRTFSVTDKTVFHDTTGYYQYGVELVIANAINKFLSDYADTLNMQISHLKEYLEETNKIAKITGDDIKGYSINGSYDPQKNAFTPNFIKNFDKPRGDKLSLKAVVASAAAYFAATIVLFGIMKDKSQSITETIVSILEPQNTRAETIQYFINIYQKLVNQIKNLVKNNYNNTFTVQHWFTNRYVDTKMPINIGYKFFDVKNYEGLAAITAADYVQKLTSDINRYSYNRNLDYAAYGNLFFSYVSPNAVYSKNKTLLFNQLNTNLESISNVDFAELEIDIKNINLNGLTADVEKVTHTVDKPEIAKKIQASLRSNRLGNSFSLKINNSVLPTSDAAAIKQNNTPVKNDSISELEIMLALTKQINLQNKSYPKILSVPITPDKNKLLSNRASKINKIEKLSDKEIAAKQTLPEQFVPVIEGDIPLQIKLLLENKSPLLKQDQNYKNSLEFVSKFEILYNTFHSVEILKYGLQDLKENWVSLTRETIDSLNYNDVHLCRLRDYKNLYAGIEGMDQVRLPIYDEHFLFVKNSIPRISIPPSKMKEEIKQLNNSITNNIRNPIINQVMSQQSNIPPVVRKVSTAFKDVTIKNNKKNK
jgi:hypothetical protein